MQVVFVHAVFPQGLHIVHPGTLQAGRLQCLQRIFRVALVLCARALLEKTAASLVPHRMQVMLFFELAQPTQRMFHVEPLLSRSLFILALLAKSAASDVPHALHVMLCFELMHV